MDSKRFFFKCINFIISCCSVLCLMFIAFCITLVIFILLDPSNKHTALAIFIIFFSVVPAVFLTKKLSNYCRKKQLPPQPNSSTYTAGNVPRQDTKTSAQIPSKKKNFCPHCGRTIPNGACICWRCGKRVSCKPTTLSRDNPFVKKAEDPPPKNTRAIARAQFLSDEIKHYYDEISNATDISVFLHSYRELLSDYDELMLLHESNLVASNQSLTQYLKRIRECYPITINAFFYRIKENFPPSGEERADAIENFLAELDSNSEFCALFQPENVLAVNLMRDEAQKIRSDIEKERIAIKNEKTLCQLGSRPNLDASKLSPFDVADRLEQHLNNLYQYVLCRGSTPSEAYQAFLDFQNNCKSSKLPLAADIRLEELLKQHEPKFKDLNPMYAIDRMDGHEFERWSTSFLIRIGFQSAEVTQASNDDGVDIIAVKDGVRYAVQCKCYTSSLGNKPIQEVHTGKSIYNCHVGAVITNRTFTSGGKKAAEATGTLLWDRDWIISHLK